MRPLAYGLMIGMLLALSACGAQGAESESLAENPKPVEAAPAAPQEIEWRIPADARARLGSGETLLVRTANGKQEVARLHCEIGPKRVVMIRTGELLLVDAEATQPTDKPFRAAGLKTITSWLESEGIKGFKTATSKPYVFFYKCSEAYFLHTRSLFETAYPGIREALEKWELELTEPEVPLVVIIMPSRQAFHRFRRVPPEVVAYYNKLTNYVVLYEDPQLAWAAPELAYKQGAFTVVHEAVHQILGSVGVQKRLSPWPMWISEGLPEYFCPVTVNSKILKTTNAELPTRTLKWSRAGMQNDLRMHALLKIPATRGDLMQAVVKSNRLNGNGYAMAWGLVHYLATQRKKKFQAYLHDVSQLVPLATPAYNVENEPDPLFVKHIGYDFASLERALQKYLTSESMQKDYRDPVLYQTHYVVKKITKYGKAFQVKVFVTTSPDGAKKWKENEENSSKDPVSATPPQFYTIQCKTGEEARNAATRLGKNQGGQRK